MPVETKQIIIDGETLSLQQMTSFLEDPSIQVALSPQARERVQKSRRQVERWLTAERKVIYGITTGLGKLKDYVVAERDQANFQQNILYSHAVGLGPCFPDDVVRLAMLLRANVLSRGHSGVRPELIERILMFLNKGIIPLIPQIGSLGVGDLQPMAHLGLCLVGAPEGEARYQGEAGSAVQQLQKAGISPVPFPLAAREALALMSGSTMVLANAIYACHKAKQLSQLADIALALNLEAMRGEINAFDERIQNARGIPAQIETARQVRALLEGSGWVTDAGRSRLGETKPRVQDAVSFRSSPQVHGAVKDVLHYVETVISREINASTDNPLLFSGESGYESLSGGNFHGAILGYALDFLGIVLTDLAVLSERRSARLLDPTASYGLPANLVGGLIGLNTGFALVQANAIALVGEMRTLAAPASIGSIPAKSNQEDHNSMAMGAVRKTMQILEHLQKVLAIELLCAAQAIDLIKDKMSGLPLGKGTALVYQLIRKSVPPMWEDSYVKADLEKMIRLVEDDTILREVKHVLT
ncbi:aromatic amino acid lyase [Brevibacillus sp. SYP-B805]|uniref:HAL/PAL/TAL family ammonia-lyase n=1 Tax=Brevibacillus sp. SYP-B805 TaxID=1578199 RepID=UPI0013EA09E2|nr:aromatic amino acid ammonia-lyase [Brevibacillus sp. SYP-B805]NGQ93944.1 aromatic amino acid lyase [Brevibacillus sp. SYP-B805]